MRGPRRRSHVRRARSGSFVVLRRHARRPPGGGRPDRGRAGPARRRSRARHRGVQRGGLAAGGDREAHRREPDAPADHAEQPPGRAGRAEPGARQRLHARRDGHRAGDAERGLAERGARRGQPAQPRATSHSADVLGRIRQYKAEVKERQADLEKEEAARKQAVSDRQARREAVEQGLAARQARLGSVKAEILDIIEAARRGRARGGRGARAAGAGGARPGHDRGGEHAVARHRRRGRRDRRRRRAATGGGGGSSGGGGTATVPAPPPASGVGASAAGVAMGQLGVPYQWAGASPGGFDCSGLVMWAFAQVGVSLPHNAAAQYGVGTPVDQAEPAARRPGLLQRPRPRRHLHRRRPVRPRTADRRRREGLVDGSRRLRGRPPRRVAWRRARCARARSCDDAAGFPGGGRVRCSAIVQSACCAALIGAPPGKTWTPLRRGR